METIIIVIFAVLCIWMIAYTIWTFGGDPLDVAIEYGTNDSESAAGLFNKVVQRATRKLIVHDDGESGTVYDDNSAIESIVNQMKRHNALVVRFHFNERRELRMVSKLRKEFDKDRFSVRYRRNQENKRPSNDIHYKIADDGAFGMLSKHDIGSESREYALVDCENAKNSERIRQFAKYMLRFFCRYHIPGRSAAA